MALSDATVAAFDTKYHYNSWRPETAIRAGSLDNNAKTDEDAAFEPFVFTPCFPGYPSAHASVSYAASEVLERLYGPSGHDISFSTPVVAGVTLHYSAFKRIVEDIDDARVFGGIHFRFDQEEGAHQGKSVGAYAVHATSCNVLRDRSNSRSSRGRAERAVVDAAIRPAFAAAHHSFCLRPDQAPGSRSGHIAVDPLGDDLRNLGLFSCVHVIRFVDHEGLRCNGRARILTHRGANHSIRGPAHISFTRAEEREERLAQRRDSGRFDLESKKVENRRRHIREVEECRGADVGRERPLGRRSARRRDPPAEARRPAHDPSPLGAAPELLQRQAPCPRLASLLYRNFVRRDRRQRHCDLRARRGRSLILGEIHPGGRSRLPSLVTPQ